MTKSKKLLIAMDGSPHSFNAVRYVARTCNPASLKVNLMHVMPTASETFLYLEKDAFFKEKMEAKYTQWKRNTKEGAQRFLDKARDLLVKARVVENDVGVILQEKEVSITRDILAECARGYDAVVVGRRDFRKLEDLFLGSVSNKIVERTKDTPVWVVRGDIRSKKILLAVDASDNSRKAVDYAGSFAAHTEAEVTLYHVVRGLEIGFVDSHAVSDEEMQEHFLEERESEIPRMFRSYKEIFEQAGVASARISNKVTSQCASRAGEILREAKEGGYGTIVVGRRGLSIVREFLMGGGTSKILNRADGVAVWIVP